ncbi:MAG: hypothetical protein NTU58_04065 [Candidatus Nealsonbacteria bacterium]|nr:hypothetical protein [Candidatus Nealsonbacteria bacterium]
MFFVNRFSGNKIYTIGKIKNLYLGNERVEIIKEKYVYFKSQSNFGVIFVSKKELTRNKMLKKSNYPLLERSLKQTLEFTVLSLNRIKFYETASLEEIIKLINSSKIEETRKFKPEIELKLGKLNNDEYITIYSEIKNKNEQLIKMQLKRIMSFFERFSKELGITRGSIL